MFLERNRIALQSTRKCWFWLVKIRVNITFLW